MVKDLGKKQREMRERIERQANDGNRKAQRSFTADERLQQDEATVASDGKMLQKRINALETENRELRAEIEQLRRHKTVYVEREKSSDEQRREQQHNYFKYSNTRRW